MSKAKIYRDGHDQYGGIKMEINGMTRAVSPVHFIGHQTIVKGEMKKGKPRRVKGKIVDTHYQYITELHPKFGERECMPFPPPVQVDPDYRAPYQPHPMKATSVDDDGLKRVWGYNCIQIVSGWCRIECIGYTWWTGEMPGVTLQWRVHESVGQPKLEGKVIGLPLGLTKGAEKSNAWTRAYIFTGFDTRPN
jgi:hypothetical protein